MVAKMLSWICSKLKTDNDKKDPFGDDPFVVL